MFWDCSHFILRLDLYISAPTPLAREDHSTPCCHYYYRHTTYPAAIIGTNSVNNHDQSNDLLLPWCHPCPYTRYPFCHWLDLCRPIPKRELQLAKLRLLMSHYTNWVIRALNYVPCSPNNNDLTYYMCSICIYGECIWNMNIHKYPAQNWGKGDLLSNPGFIEQYWKWTC